VRDELSSIHDECLRDSGFISEQHVSHMQIMSMPQFATHPTGFASRCDWVIGSRLTRSKRTPQIDIYKTEPRLRGDEDHPPTEVSV
jgi:hypothetical protein